MSPAESYIATRRSDRTERKTAVTPWRAQTSASLSARTSSMSSSTAPRSGNNIFPKQLLEILSDRNSLGVIEWLPHGHAFAIKNPERFSTDIMPKFTRGKLTSFQRQLNLYGFRKVTKGPDHKAGALVYFHPAFKRGRPEMMEGIKRIACKGDLSLNRLRNDDVPYDPNVPSEETDEPEQDVNSLKKPTRKRKRGWRDDRLGKRAQDGDEADTADAMSLRKVIASPNERKSSGAKPRTSDGGGAVQPARPAVPPSVDMKDLPTRSTDYSLQRSTVSKLNQMYQKFTVPTTPSVESLWSAAESGVSTPPSKTGISSDSNPNLEALLTQESDQLPRRMNIPLPKQYILQKENESRDALKHQDSEPVTVLPKRLNLPPLRSHLTKTELEDLMPVPLSPSVSSGQISAALSMPKRYSGTFSSSEPLKRTVSEVSGFSGASELWHIDDLESDLDFAGMFD